MQHECDEEHVQVLAGDFNMREGEDQCFSQQHWVDAMQASATDSTGESWTWRKAEARMRFDRIYTHASHTSSLVVVQAKRLTQV